MSQSSAITLHSAFSLECTGYLHIRETFRRVVDHLRSDVYLLSSVIFLGGRGIEQRYCRAAMINGSAIFIPLCELQE